MWFARTGWSARGLRFGLARERVLTHTVVARRAPGFVSELLRRDTSEGRAACQQDHPREIARAGPPAPRMTSGWFRELWTDHPGAAGI